MSYLTEFFLATEKQETGYLLSNAPKLNMTCYSGTNVYPFKIFPFKYFDRAGFESVTLLCGGNGSGKSTMLNIIAQKLGLKHSAPWNNTPFFEDYLKFCSYEPVPGKKIPENSRIITSDDVFDYLLNRRAMNDGISDRREELFREYWRTKDEDGYTLSSLEDYDELVRRNEVRRGTISKYVKKRSVRELDGKSNGESAFDYFTEIIKDNALYLLDEPENSLSAALQLQLSKFITDSARFYGCQFIISTHSPFLLGMENAVIYDLDAQPVRTENWTRLPNVRLYYEFFKEHEKEFADSK